MNKIKNCLNIPQSLCILIKQLKDCDIPDDELESIVIKIIESQKDALRRLADK